MIKEKRGITLIALIITIIVLLILAGVTISSISSDDGILTKTQQANSEAHLGNEKETISLAVLEYQTYSIEPDADYYKFLQEKFGENNVEQINNDTFTIKFVDCGHKYIVSKNQVYDNGYWIYDDTLQTVTNGEIVLNIGDYINYNCGVEEYVGSWRVLGVEDGCLKILSDDNVSIVNLSGKEGYENGIEQLNNVCEEFLNEKYAISSRSITVEDIDAITGFSNKSDYAKNEMHEYNNEVTYTINSNNKIAYTTSNGKSGTLSSSYGGPDYIDIDGIILSSDSSIENSKTEIKIVNTFYSYKISDYLDVNSKVYNMLCESTEKYVGNSSFCYGSYWLASTKVSNRLNKSPYYGTEGTRYGIVYFGNQSTSGLEPDVNAYPGYFFQNLYSAHKPDENGFGNTREFGVRAVVTLSRDIEFDTNDASKDGSTASNAFELK